MWEGRPGGMEGLGSAAIAASYCILSIPPRLPHPRPRELGSFGKPPPPSRASVPLCWGVEGRQRSAEDSEGPPSHPARDS